jgi:ABC-type nitrate/sulfonate/bicarbonate transport system substrate-binding protein
MKQIRDTLAMRVALVFVCLLLSWGLGEAQDRKLQALNISYASISATRAPIWIGKEMGVFEKYGLNVSPIHIASGSASYSALMAGDVLIVSDTASAAVAAGARAPIVILRAPARSLTSYWLIRRSRRSKACAAKLSA